MVLAETSGWDRHKMKLADRISYVCEACKAVYPGSCFGSHKMSHTSHKPFVYEVLSKSLKSKCGVVS